MLRPLAALGLCLLLGLFFATAVHAAEVENAKASIEKQREIFRTVFDDVERGNWNSVDQLSERDRQLLRQYALWPDLKATWLRANISRAGHAKINAFIEQHSTLKPARELRYRYALNFVRHKNLAAYLKIYERFYQGQEIPKLDCLALQAEIAAGRLSRVHYRALDLWMIGKSQVTECDPVFAHLNRHNLLGLVEHKKRFKLAVESRNFSLAKWLAKKIDGQHVEIANLWQQAQANSADFLKTHRIRSSNATLREQLVYAAERLTYRDPEIALALWKQVVGKHNFSEAQKLRTLQHIALWTARDNLPGAYELLSALAPAAVSEEVLRWRARVSLREGRWRRLKTDIDAMSDAERNSEEWRYWRAIASLESGQAAAARAALEALSQERSYYGFLAADRIEQPYSLSHSELLANEQRLAELESEQAIIRARELFFVGQDGRGRSEWDAIVRHLSAEDKIQAAILADRWGWHSRAIATAASLGEYDDLSIRYPLPYQETFEAYSSAARISSTWAYGIARSESLFMRDVRSHAGAIGLMQLMPATGKDVARDIELPYRGITTLTNPTSNIRLGTSYLGQMAKRYGGNSVLATAAYNAGPHRVDAWLPESGSLDARVWIENIPFNETRKYVKRVMSAQSIFHWRMTGEVRRLSDDLLLVQATPRIDKVASR